MVAAAAGGGVELGGMLGVVGGSRRVLDQMVAVEGTWCPGQSPLCPVPLLTCMWEVVGVAAGGGLLAQLPLPSASCRLNGLTSLKTKKEKKRKEEWV